MLFLIVFLAFFTPLLAQQEAPAFQPTPFQPTQRTQTSIQSAPAAITVHNRVLVKVNGKALSVVDLMKKLDIFFYQQYPQMASSNQARFQFYAASWPGMLNDMIDAELILADAEEKKVTVSDGDVREELEHLFGPNVVLTIDSLGLTFEEAWDMLHKDLMVKRMSWYMVNSKAMQQLNPKDIRIAYEAYVREHPKENQWRYQVLTFRAPEESQSQALAEAAHLALSSQISTIASLEEDLKQQGILNEGSSVSVSEVFDRNDKSLSDAHRAVLQTLSTGGYSPPAMQTTRGAKAPVARIFALLEVKENKPLAFAELEEQIKENLINKAVEEESLKYRVKLRTRFGITDDYLNEMIAADFQPFSYNP